MTTWVTLQPVLKDVVLLLFTVTLKHKGKYKKTVIESVDNILQPFQTHQKSHFWGISQLASFVLFTTYCSSLSKSIPPGGYTKWFMGQPQWNIVPSLHGAYHLRIHTYSPEMGSALLYKLYKILESYTCVDLLDRQPVSSRYKASIERLRKFSLPFGSAGTIRVLKI